MLFLLPTSLLCVAAGPLRTFGGAKNQQAISETEQTLLIHDLDALGRMPDEYAVLTHFWAGGQEPQTGDATIRYYVDNETKASVVFTPSRAVGLEFAASKNQAVPWGTAHMGKTARVSGYYHNFRVPFRSIRITFQLSMQSKEKAGARVYFIARGTENLPLRIGDMELDGRKARLVTRTKRFAVQPLDRYDLVSVPRGVAGLVLMSSISVRHSKSNVQYLEACFRFSTPPDAAWPGSVVLSTGGEDYYDGAYYFDSGAYHLPVSGVTYLNINSTSGISEWSAYRFHDNDPLVFEDGARLSWRHGETEDMSTSHKCGLQTGGVPLGDIGPANITTQSWVYQW